MASKTRANLYLDTEIYQRAQAIAEKMPGVSVSGLVESGLRSSVPLLETMVAAFEQGDSDAARDMLRLAMGEQMLSFMERPDPVRMLAQMIAEKGGPK